MSPIFIIVLFFIQQVYCSICTFPSGTYSTCESLPEINCNQYSACELIVDQRVCRQITYKCATKTNCQQSTPPSPIITPQPTPKPTTQPTNPSNVMYQEILDNYPYAKCLDGSSYSIYIRGGTGTGSNKWILYHNGGGWCTSYESCFQRMTTDRGSSSTYGPTMVFNNNYISKSSSVNPFMNNWNQVYLNYCDGASFTGSKIDPVNYLGTNMYFRGKYIVDAIIDHLNQIHDFKHAEQVIISGMSAGGLATIFNLNQYCDNIVNGNCVGFIDSGFFWDYQDPSKQCTLDDDTRNQFNLQNGIAPDADPGTYRCDMQWVYTRHQSILEQNCLNMFKGKEYECMFAKNMVPHVRYPIFFENSIYDSWQRDRHLINKNSDTINNMGNQLRYDILTSINSQNKNSIAYLDSCTHHTLINMDWRDIRAQGIRLYDALNGWLQDKTSYGNIIEQSANYPCSACCVNY